MLIFMVIFTAIYWQIESPVELRLELRIGRLAPRVKTPAQLYPILYYKYVICCMFSLFIDAYTKFTILYW